MSDGMKAFLLVGAIFVTTLFWPEWGRRLSWAMLMVAVWLLWQSAQKDSRKNRR